MLAANCNPISCGCISASAPRSPIVSVRFPRSARPTRRHGAAARPSSPRAAPVWASLHAANPWCLPGRSRSAVLAQPCGLRRLASAGFRMAPWCPGAAAWRPLRDVLDGYGRSAVEARAAARWVPAPLRAAWSCPARAHRLTSRGRAGCMWTRRKRLGLACSTFNIDRLTADRLPNRSMLPSVAVSEGNGGRSNVPIFLTPWRGSDPIPRARPAVVFCHDRTSEGHHRPQRMRHDVHEPLAVRRLGFEVVFEVVDGPRSARGRDG